ncbi:MAG: helix-turn-helix domain-containing protein [Bacteroidales bacterium]
MRRSPGKKIDTVPEETLVHLRSHAWKGNIRELENLVERMVTIAMPAMKSLEPSLLPKDFRDEHRGEIQDESPEKTEQADAPATLPLQESLAQHEKRAIEKALESCNWNQSAAARLLEVSEHTIRYKMKKLGISKP